MGIKKFNIEFQELTDYKFIRNDVRFFIGQKEKKLNDGIRLGKLFKTGRGKVINQEYVEENQGVYPLYSSQTQNEGVFGLIDTYDFDGEYLTWTTDGANAGRVFYRNGKFSCTNVCGTAKLINNHIFNLNLKFLPYLLNTITKYYISIASGNPKLMNNVFEEIKIPKIPLQKQNETIELINPIENQILKISNSILPPQDIIDKVFAQHFGFDIENADKKKKELVHYASLEDLANEELKFDISLKYRYIFFNYIKNTSNIEWIELGKLVDVKGGKRLPKGQNITEEETNYKYIRVDDLSWSGVFDLENIKYISEENHNAIKNYIAKENDILLTIVGATVGKCGLVPAELDGENITENFARLIIKDKDSYLPEYVNYCLQSKTSVYQIDEYKGRGSQGKLALFRIKKIKMPKIGKTQQQEIVDEIKAELDKQELLKQQITTERNKIDKIIEECIMTAQ
ncbi:MAG: restriction endonuclease subunit S [Bacteroidetes bacterium]|nr:restriction endonuclease subunit S [Bacteroidota bacterium]